MTRSYKEVDISDVMVTLNLPFKTNNKNLKEEGNLAILQFGTTIFLHLELENFVYRDNCYNIIGELKTVDIYGREIFSKAYMFLIIGRSIQCAYRIPSMTLKVFVQVEE